eukprot:TRINITY_DN2342_c0_g1_i1.p1 TRINITY_DN2342_c0_g1~~TRINITY_DN2342_c0_g1_i1.p1  ORF type:complete len:229 (-),score=34.66 TRINITY_DN2342_c0_g1_i1:1046-1732(-)
MHLAISMVNWPEELDNYFSILEKPGNYDFNTSLPEDQLKHMPYPLSSLMPNQLKGWTVLHLAVFCECEFMVQHMIELGVDVNKRNNDGLTAPMLGVLYNQWKNVKVVLKSGFVDYMLRDNQGNDIVDQVIHKDNYAIDQLQFIVDNGGCVCFQKKYLPHRYQQINNLQQRYNMIELLDWLDALVAKLHEQDQLLRLHDDANVRLDHLHRKSQNKKRSKERRMNRKFRC